MIRIRFHGRGGHGIKTAARIVGTAAFLAGHQAQDSPMFGAERRGAAVTACTRIDTLPILERGAVSRPDLIVVGDETLLMDPAAAVLVGQESASAVFVNAKSSADLADKYRIGCTVISLDITGRTQQALGTASAFSTGLGAAATKLTGCGSEQHLVQSVREELKNLGLPDDSIAKNVELACEVYAALSTVEFHSVGATTDDQIYTLGYDGPVRGAPSILAAGNAQQRNTGSWRVERPVIDYEVCSRCGLCSVNCPEGAVVLDKDGYPIIDYDHCKGCMICWQLCPLQAIEKKPEVRA